MSDISVPACNLVQGPPVSEDLSSLLPGFSHGEARVADPAGLVTIPYSTLGAGPPLLLLHGHPQTRAIWARVAPTLAAHFTVVLTDLRGYGDAAKPFDAPGAPAHSAYEKRAMAGDQVALMQALGHDRFAVLAHDRGARVAHRLALDHPGAVSQLMLLDIAPTLAMYEQTDMAFARAYWHWFYLIQPAPLPEAMISNDPDNFLLRLMGNRSAGLAPFLPAALAEYLRAARNPETIRAICEDYRASAGPDLVLDRADRDRGHFLQCPVRVLWGNDGIIGKLFDPVALWRSITAADYQVSGAGLDSGHYLPEEAHAEVLAEALTYFGRK